MNILDEGLLDDQDGIARADAADTLRALAGAGAQVRRAAQAAREAVPAAISPRDRPRTVILAAPAYGPLGHALRAVTGADAALPLVLAAGGLLPGWAGPMDLVLLAGRGDEPALIDLAGQAYRRGCQVVAATPAGSALDAAVQQSRGVVVRVPVDATPVGAAGYADDTAFAAQTAFWPLFTALLAITGACGASAFTPGEGLAGVDAAADRLDEVSNRCRPGADAYLNPAKGLAVAIAGTIPVIWGAGTVAGVAAERFATMCVGVAATPALSGALPTGGRYQDRVFAAGGSVDAGDPDDFFRDRVDEAESVRLHPVLLVDHDDAGAAPQLDRAKRTLTALGRSAVGEVGARGGSPVERLAELIAVTDFAAVYLALGTGVGPAVPGLFSWTEGGPR
ncbi:mannose-6-phosphate isomerase [Embleya sp. NBC_00888]|uniref:SIS domain-containing protein n=1 Tax=Embleya sp. NBC_00888 TaxID=2975960 RepID=UPI00386B6232|nr:mannose-6-phosphate isomerase [Embleya sp. NBC_00888]